MRNSIVVAILSLLFTQAAVAKETDELKTVQYVDLNRYIGLWYEIARLPNWFEKDACAVTAEYSLMSNGRIRVVNSARIKTINGKFKQAKGKAFVADKNTNAKLKVSFFWPFYGNYWIIELDRDYEYAVVGEPGRQYLWILSRKPVMGEQLYNELLAKIEAKGYNLQTLIKTIQK